MSYEPTIIIGSQKEWWTNFEFTKSDKRTQDLTPILNKIISNSYIFKWVPANVLYSWLKQWKIWIEKISKWTNIIKENDKNSYSFFVLLDWDLWIFKWRLKLASIQDIAVFGEIWFLNHNIKRTATVKAMSESVIMVFSDDFIQTLDPIISSLIYRNLAIELTNKLVHMNDMVEEVKKWEIDSWHLTALKEWITVDIIQTMKV